jgi:hypothetical protein
MDVTIRKMTYSRSPWRLGVLHADGQFVELQYLWFDRKRDATPWLRELEALALPWEEPPKDWSQAQRTALLDLIRRAPGYQDWLALVQVPRAPGGR